MDEYSRQRKERLQEAIDDYLLDDAVPSRRIYEEMLSCIDDTLSYYEKQADRIKDLKHLMMGHRLVDDMEDLAVKWQYDKLPDRY